MKDTANKKPSKECKAPPMVARLLTGLFLYCLWQTRGRKGEKLIYDKSDKGDAGFAIRACAT